MKYFRPDVYKSDLIINTGLSSVDYFKQKQNRKDKEADEIEEPPKKKSKRNKIDQFIDFQDIPSEVKEEEDHCVPESTEESVKRKKKKDKTVVEEEIQLEEKPRKKKKKSKEIIDEELPVEETQKVEIQPINEIKSKKKKKLEIVEEQQDEVTQLPLKKKKSKLSSSSETQPITSAEMTLDEKKPKADADLPKGANAVYTTDVIQINQHVANKISNVDINAFANSNLGEIVGYGMSENIELKVVKTKFGDRMPSSTDKYALYNMDKLQTKRVNPRKIKTKLKKTKKSIQVI